MAGDMFHWPLISSNSHIVEPPDLRTERLDRRYRDRAPRVVTTSVAPQGVAVKGSVGVEFQQQTIAGRLDDAPAVRSDQRVDDVAAQCLQGRERAALIPTHQSRIPRDIGCNDCR